MNYDRPETTAVNNISKSARVKRPISKIADRDTPLIKNCWYVLDWSEKLWATEERPDYHENHVPSDGGTVKLRRIVAQLSVEENL